MPFPKAVRERALVAAARHCCVCRRYKGVRVEVHHLTPEADGGANEFDNTIVLCFDCHADAGHYNPRHPRGTKFSVQEMRWARDRWYEKVASGDVEEPSAYDSLYVRYIVCKDTGALEEIVAGDLSRIPVEAPRLLKNDVLTYLGDLLSHQRQQVVDLRLTTEKYRSEEEYQRVHPDAIHVAGVRGGLPYFDAERVPSSEELQSRFAGQHAVTTALLDLDIPPEQIARATAHWEYCGDDHLAEVYHLRPFWGVFLTASNLTAELLTVDALECLAADRRAEFRAVNARTDEVLEVDVPPIALGPGETLMVPVATAIGPLGAPDEKGGWAEHKDLETGQVQAFEHATTGPQDVLKYGLLGPSYHPKAIFGRTSDGALRQPVHGLDMANTYLLSRYFEMGSCPHLFARIDGERLQYVRELFAREAGAWQMEVVVAQEGWDVLYIAELEEETTELCGVWRNGRRLSSWTRLVQGDVIATVVRAGDLVRLSGRYTPRSRGRGERNPWRRNQLIRRFIGAYSVSSVSIGT